MFPENRKHVIRKKKSDKIVESMADQQNGWQDVLWNTYPESVYDLLCEKWKKHLVHI